jgi:heterodisulfide reductase subunit D
MSGYSFLEEFRDKVYYCFKCGMCRFESYEGLSEGTPALFSIVCPAWDLWKLEAYTALGRNEICRGLLEAKIPLDEKTVKIIYACTLCGACKEQCSIAKKTKHIEKFGGSTLPYNPLDISMALRRQAVESGIGPLLQHKKFEESIELNRNPYFEPHSKRFDLFEEGKVAKKNADIVYFAGCTAAYRQQPIAESTVKILGKLGINYAVIDEWCCGSPLLMTGQYRLAEQIAKHNVEEIKALSVKTVVTSCAGCFRVLKELYPELVGELPFEVMHVTQFFNDLLQKRKLTFSKPLNMSVTYHDPCHLGRHMKIYEEPRAILENLPGVKVVEMERIKSYSYCCGAGAGFRSGFPEKSIEVASIRVEEAEKTGANCLTTACPFCLTNLSDGAKKINSRLSVCNIEQVILQAL